MRQIVVWLFLGAVGSLLLSAPLWLWFAVASSAFLGLLLLFDAFFFAEKDIYLEGGWEPTVVSGAMQLVPWLIIPWFVPIRWTDASAIAMFAGLLNMASFVPYFRAMKIDQDAVVVSVMWNIVIGIVPVLAFFILKEKLSVLQYAGVAMIFLGASIGVWERTTTRKRVVGLMLVAVAISSIQSIVGKDSLGLAIDWKLFWNVFLFFGFGEGLFAAFALGRIRARREVSHLVGLVGRFWVAFLFIEGCQIAFAVSNWRAMSLGPVSLTTAIDGLSGPFLIASIVLASFLFRRTRYSWNIRKLEAKQVRHFRRKLFGMVIVMVGAYFAAGGN